MPPSADSTATSGGAMSGLSPTQRTQFGRATREAHFQFAPTYMPLNHGSYGATPRAVQAAQRAVIERCEARPDTFMRFDLSAGQNASRALMAKVLHCSMDDLVLLPNISTCSDTVLRNIVWEAGDVLLYCEATYGALEKSILYQCERTPLRAVRLPVHWPMSDDELVEGFTKELARINAEPGRRVRMAIVDTIVSMPGVRLPWERLVEATRVAGAWSLVDGAHGVGQIEINLGEAKPDFFASNLHKWMHVPRPCAVLYVRKELQPLMRSTLPTSHGFLPRPELVLGMIRNPLPIDGEAAFSNLFSWYATNDYSSQLTIGAALEWREMMGGEEAIRKWCVSVAQRGADRAASILGTEVMDVDGSSMRTDCAMANVRLPIEMGLGAGQIHPCHEYPVYLWLQTVAAQERDTAFQTLFYHGNWWWRISGQVYVEEDDVEQVAMWAKDWCTRVMDGAWEAEWTKMKV